jgi:quercetin dioxygenase-like cupin family protein
VAEHVLGCSGATEAKLIRVRDSLPSHTHADADEFLYMVAGESAVLTIGGKDQIIGAAWLGIIPRGTPHALTRRSGPYLLMLSILSGPPCPSGAASGAK